MRNRPTSMTERYGERTTRTVADVVTFKAEDECVRVGGNVHNYDDMLAATARVLKSDPKLHAAYLDDPNAPEGG